MTELVVDARKDRFAISPLSHVTPNRKSAAPRRCGDVGSNGFAIGEIAASDDNVGAGIGQAIGHCPTNPAAAAGNNGDPSGEIDALSGYLHRRTIVCDELPTIWASQNGVFSGTRFRNAFSSPESGADSTVFLTRNG